MSRFARLSRWNVLLWLVCAHPAAAEDAAATGLPMAQRSWWSAQPSATEDAAPTALGMRAQVPGQWQAAAYAGTEAARSGLTPGAIAALGLGHGLAATAGVLGVRPTAGVLWRLWQGEQVRVLVGGRWKGEGFTEPEGEVEGIAAVSVALPGQWQAHGNAIVGGDPDGNGWDVEGSASVVRLFQTFGQLGVEARTLQGREKGAARNMTTAGPSARVDFGRVALIGAVGVQVGHTDASPGVGPWGMLRLAIQ